MALNLASVPQVSRLLTDTVYAANAIMTLKAQLDQFDSEQSIADAINVLRAQGASLPASFTVSAADLKDAIYAAAALRGDLVNSLAAKQAALDKLRLSLGMLIGTG